MDQLDRDLLRILQKDAKTPFTKIAKELDQPDTTNTVTRFCALVRPEALGYSAAAIIRIEIGGHIVPDISKGRARTFADELAKEEHYLWVAVEDEPMVVHALMMGLDEDDIRKKTETLRKSPDIVNVTIIPVNSVAKGWEISGLPE
jgi:DNA-binding Lrp family transcriptional regulator